MNTLSPSIEAFRNSPARSWIFSGGAIISHLPDCAIEALEIWFVNIHCQASCQSVCISLPERQLCRSQHQKYENHCVFSSLVCQRISPDGISIPIKSPFTDRSSRFSARNCLLISRFSASCLPYTSDCRAVSRTSSPESAFHKTTLLLPNAADT